MRCERTVESIVLLYVYTQCDISSQQKVIYRNKEIWAWFKKVTKLSCTEIKEETPNAVKIGF